MVFSKNSNKPRFSREQIPSSPQVTQNSLQQMNDSQIIFTSSIKYDMLNRLMNTTPCKSCGK
jgi:hypothetical protein